MQTYRFIGLTVYPYGLCLAVAALLALALAGVMGWRRRLPPGTVRAFALIGMPLGLLCSRALYCAINYKLFVDVWQRPALMLRFFDGGLSMPGLLIGLMLAARLSARLMKARFASLADALCAPVMLFVAVARAAERFTDLGVGKVVDEGALTQGAPWLFLMQRSGKAVEYRLAVYNYEAAVALVLFAALLALFFAKSARLRPGDLALLAMSLYGSTQVLFESMRDDGHMLIIFLRVGQLLAVCMPIAATGVLTKRYVRLTGRVNARAVAGWVVTVLCVGMLTLLEFMLDGRVTIGEPSMARDYLVMLATCAALCAVPCSLLVTLNKRLYRSETISVRAPVA